MLNHAVQPQPWPDSRWAKELQIKSKLLSDFHHREVVERRGVVLPASYYDQSQRRYPVVYMIPGFGGAHL